MQTDLQSWEVTLRLQKDFIHGRRRSSLEEQSPRSAPWCHFQRTLRWLCLSSQKVPWCLAVWNLLMWKFLASNIWRGSVPQKITTCGCVGTKRSDDEEEAHKPYTQCPGSHFGWVGLLARGMKRSLFLISCFAMVVWSVIRSHLIYRASQPLLHSAAWTSEMPIAPFPLCPHISSLWCSAPF